MNYIFTLPYDPSKYTVVENSLQIAFPLPSDVKAGQEITRTGKMDLDPGTVKSFHPASNKSFAMSRLPSTAASKKDRSKHDVFVFEEEMINTSGKINMMPF